MKQTARSISRIQIQDHLHYEALVISTVIRY